MTFELPMIVPVGSHVYSFMATDGLSRAWTGNLSLTVEGEGEPPTLTLFVDSPEGTAETLFTFTAFYEDEDGDPAEYVRLSLSGTTVIELVSEDGHRYSAATTLPPGTIEATAMSSDGANVVVSNAQQVLVHERNSSRPAWDTFLRIRDTVDRGGFGAIEYMDVSLSSHEGNLVWSVATGDGEVLVSHDGTRIIDRPRGGDEPTWTFVLGAFIMGVLAIALGIVLVRSADRSQRGAKGGRR